MPMVEENGLPQDEAVEETVEETEDTAVEVVPADEDEEEEGETL